MKKNTNPEDLLQECYYRLSFVSGVFAQPKGKEFIFSQDGHYGFYHIIAGIESDIKAVLNGLAAARKAAP